MNYLGLDYGAKHIGIAASSGPLAGPLATVTDPKSIADYVFTLHVDAIVVGDCPSEFLTLLKTFGLPVHQVDETLSSHDAREALSHTTQSRRQAGEHAAAAAIILQSWLDAHS